ncbi:hypothetical protein [Kitasatospora sp. NPDC058190]
MGCYLWNDFTTTPAPTAPTTDLVDAIQAEVYAVTTGHSPS